uniref:Uncharacterized protein LOC114342383 isoform X1 n=1 Tax=Diabrotica virgifera virgifera TaxID=50390 RepID=A0A6P7GYX0_DIAVI
MEQKRSDQSFFKFINQKYNRLKLLIQFRITDVNSRNIWNKTPLHFAVLPGDEELARLLIKSGASVNCVDTNGDTPLHWAVRFGSVDTVIQLLKHRSDVNSRNNNGFTPLHEAVYAETVKTSKCPLGSNAYLNVRIPRGLKYIYDNVGNEFLVTSAPTLHYIYDNAGNEFIKIYPCHLSILSTDTASTLVRILVEAGADVNQQTVEGWTPLHFAVQRSLIDVVDILLQNGASIILTAQNLPVLLRMPRKVRALYGICYKVVNDDNIHVDSGSTVLHQAAELPTTDIAKLILDKGADINAQNSRGKTALHIAVENSQRDMVKFLILNGANINKKDNHGKAPLGNSLDLLDFSFDKQIWIKYIVLWQKRQEYLFMKSSLIDSRMQTWWDHCEDTVNKMKDFSFEKSNISLYTILRNIFNDHQVAEYIQTKLINQSSSDWICIDIYCKMFPEYKEVIKIIPHKLKAAEQRNSLLDKLLSEFNGIMHQLPPEILLEICSYLNNYDFKNFVLAFSEAS